MPSKAGIQRDREYMKDRRATVKCTVKYRHFLREKKRDSNLKVHPSCTSKYEK